MRIHRTSARWALLVTVLAMAVAACSGDMAFENIGAPVAGADDQAAYGTEDTGSRSGTDLDEAADGLAESDATELGSGGIVPAAVAAVDFGRDIIFTASLTVAVPDVVAAGEEATTIITGVGGFLFGQETTGGPEPRSVLVFKVQPRDFETALARLGSIGEIRSQQVSSDDVTDRVVDLQSQIATATASVDRLRRLLADADDIETIVAVENELLQRETQLESLRGSLRTLEDQVSLATITVTMTEAAAHPSLAVAMTAYPGHDAGSSCPGGGSVTVDEGTEATVCFEVTNTGDTFLADVDLRDPVLDLETADLTVVYGDPTQPIEPGASVMYAAELVPVRDLRARTAISAVAVDETGAPIDERPVQASVGLAITATDPGGIPTFAQAFSASLEFLVDLGAMAMLALGALIPFVWVPVGAWLLLRLWRGRRREAAVVEEETDEPESELVSAG